MNTLRFRPRAIEAQRESLYGAPLAASVPAIGWMVGAGLIAAVSLLGFSAWAQYTRKEHVVGYLTPTRGLIKLYTPQAGTVVERRVQEGQPVRQGEVLLVLSSERYDSAARGAQATVLAQLKERYESLEREKSKQQALDQLDSNAIAQRVSALNTQLQQARAQITLQTRRVESAELTVKRYGDLVAARFMSDAASQQKQDELLDQRSRLADLERNASGLLRELSAANAELAMSGLKHANNVSPIGRQMSELRQELAETETRRTVILTAAADATVTTILAEPGQTVSPGTPLLSLLPAGAALEAELMVPTRAAGFIRPGQPVALRYQAFPYQRFGHHQGEIVRVGRTVIQPNEMSVPTPLSEPVYRVTVRLPAQQVHAYGQAMDLQSGMAVDADIWIERRRVFEWLLEPLFSLTKRV